MFMIITMSPCDCDIPQGYTTTHCVILNSTAMPFSTFVHYCLAHIYFVNSYILYRTIFILGKFASTLYILPHPKVVLFQYSVIQYLVIYSVLAAIAQYFWRESKILSSRLYPLMNNEIFTDENEKLTYLARKLRMAAWTSIVIFLFLFLIQNNLSFEMIVRFEMLFSSNSWWVTLCIYVHMTSYSNS